MISLECLVAFSVATSLFAPCGVDGVSHWIASDEGEIKPEIPSIFSLRSPGDLSAIYRQEDRLKLVKALRKELQHRKEEIDRSDEDAENAEERLFAEDTDCQIAGTPLTDLDLYVTTVVPFESKLKTIPKIQTFDNRLPDCKRYQRLDFSMHAFEHLISVRDRRNLTMLAETNLHRAITDANVDSVEEFGQKITKLLDLEVNWASLNLAALYWREIGSAESAIECLRRALHLSPHEVKDVSLISLANVLHRSQYSDEAAIVIHAAIDIAPDNPICHFTLGNIYAYLGEYNKSVICYENMLRLQPEFRSARQRLHAVLCQAKVAVALEKQSDDLETVLDKLKEYQHRKELYVSMINKIMDEVVIPPEYSKQCDAPSDCPVKEGSGFPFYDNMMDLQFSKETTAEQYKAKTEHQDNSSTGKKKPNNYGILM